MKLILIFFSAFTLSTSVFAQGDKDKPVLFKGIGCIAAQEINGIKPFLIIRDISKSNATLILDMDGGIPDIRNASLDSLVENGRLVVGYVSHPSAVTPERPNFAVYTNGSTPENTNRAVLTFENNDSEIQMTCYDGMNPPAE